MAGCYDAAKASFFGAASVSPRLDLDSTDVLQVRATASSYVYAPGNTTMTPVTKYPGTTDQGIVGVVSTAATPTVTFDNANVDPTYTAVAASGSLTINALTIFRFTTNDASSVPIFYLDGFTPITPNNGNVVVTFFNGTQKIASL